MLLNIRMFVEGADALARHLATNPCRRLDQNDTLAVLKEYNGCGNTAESRTIDADVSLEKGTSHAYSFRMHI